MTTYQVYQPQNRELFRDFWFHRHHPEMAEGQNLFELAKERPGSYMTCCHFTLAWTVEADTIHEAYRSVEFREGNIKQEIDFATSLEIGHIIHSHDSDQLYLVEACGFLPLGLSFLGTIQ